VKAYVLGLLTLEATMWKLIVGFVVIAGLAFYVLSKGVDIDLSGEKHDTGGHPPAEVKK
jgi:hypothetical protein